MPKKIPNFICIGAQKAGTTTLHDILVQHSKIFLPELKEAHFFDDEVRYSKGIAWWSETFFSEANEEPVIGVFTPEYLFYSEVPQRLFNHLGSELKIMVLLRNPVDRAYSHYLMSKRRGFEKLTFKDACKEEVNRINIGEFERNNFSYIGRGLYYKQLKRYISLFPNENILVIPFESHLKGNLELTINKIEQFLCINHEELNLGFKSNQASTPRFDVINKLIYKDNIIKKTIGRLIKSTKVKNKLAKYVDNANQIKITKSQLSNDERKLLLNEYFMDDICKLENLLQQSFSEWYRV